jgi:hypothetical protein
MILYILELSNALRWNDRHLGGQSMIDYTGLKCPVCEQPFTQSDDIVVCPECGAPHHRDCYLKIGHCAFEDKHGTDEDWSHQEHEREKERPKECPRCHAMNEEEALFCKECGQSLHYYSKTVGEQPKNPGTPPQNQRYQPPPPGWTPFPGATPQNGYPNAVTPLDPLGGVQPSEDFDGVSAQELAKVVQGSTRYYLPVFSRIKNFGRSRFNFAAFFFSGGFFLFRKMYLPGSIFIAIKAALVVGNILLQNLFIQPLMHTLFPNLSGSVSIYQANQMAPLILNQGGWTVFLFLLPFLLSAAEFALGIVLGIKANKIYYKHCIRTVKQAKAEAAGEAELDAALRKKGGVNMILATILLACFIALYFLPYYAFY